VALLGVADIGEEENLRVWVRGARRRRDLRILGRVHRPDEVQREDGVTGDRRRMWLNREGRRARAVAPPVAGCMWLRRRLGIAPLPMIGMSRLVRVEPGP
jgi:hypothetical protein